MNHRVDPTDQIPRRGRIAQPSIYPFDGPGHIVEAAPVTARTKPTSQSVTCFGHTAHNVPPEKSRRSRQCKLHDAPPSCISHTMTLTPSPLPNTPHPPH